MKKMILTATGLLLVSSVVFGTGYKALKGIGFFAPNVNGTGNVGNPETGAIVFDTGSSGFYGYTGPSPGWVPLGGSAAVIPPGVITAFGGTTPPTGWLLCDGSVQSATTYTALFAAIGNTYGPGSGPDTFNLPDLRGIFPRGTGTNEQLSYSAGGDVVGPALGDYQNDQMQGHVHALASVSPTGGGYTIPGGANQGVISSSGAPQSDGTNGTPRTGNETRPFSVGVNYIIKI